MTATKRARAVVPAPTHVRPDPFAQTRSGNAVLVPITDVEVVQLVPGDQVFVESFDGECYTMDIIIVESISDRMHGDEPTKMHPDDFRQTCYVVKGVELGTGLRRTLATADCLTVVELLASRECGSSQRIAGITDKTSNGVR